MEIRVTSLKKGPSGSACDDNTMNLRETVTLPTTGKRRHER